jgi:site-specific recombinase XerD
VNTLRAYRADWNHFTAWCAAHEQASLPAVPETVAYYLTALASSHKPATLVRRLTAISKAHQAAGHSSPASTQHACVSEILKGIKRTVGTAQPGKEPLFTPEIRKMIDALPANLQGARDRALLVIGFAGGFRRSELASLDVEDVAETGDGLVLALRRSKTDQEGQGAKVALPFGSYPETCPVRSFRAWTAASGITAGPVFRGVNNRGQLAGKRLDSNSVARIVKRCARRAGLDPAPYAGHSLRAGFCTQAYLNGVPELSIMRQSRHQSLTPSVNTSAINPSSAITPPQSWVCDRTAGRKQTSAHRISRGPEGKCAEADTAPKTLCRILPKKAFLFMRGYFDGSAVHVDCRRCGLPIHS